MKRRLCSPLRLHTLACTALSWTTLLGCSSADSNNGGASGDGSGGANDGSTGGASEEAPGAGGTTQGSGGHGEGPVGTGGVPGNTDAALGSGGDEAPGSGGTDENSASGGDGTGGNSASGGDGSGGSDAGVDADGCPLTQEGFSTRSALGQDGTSGGAEGPVVTVSTQVELEQYASSEEPYVIRVDGTITIVPKGKEVNIRSNKTIIGVGTTGEINEGGFFVGAGEHNIILRNLKIGNTFKEDDPEGKDQDWDGIQIDTGHHIWIDHCDFHHGGDGLIDSRKDTTNLTVSWSILRDHNKAFGIGWTENVTAEMTIHHNIIRNTTQRNPSTDNVLRAHLYNNWLENVTSYGNYARGATNMVLENSVFENVNNPHYYDTGSLVAIGNIYSETSGQKESSGSVYSFFDPTDFYDYDLDDAAEVKALLTQCAGPRPSLGN